jgi:hypothetical protein
MGKCEPVILSKEMLWTINEFFLLALALLGFFVAMEIGYRFGLRHSSRKHEGTSSYMSVLQTAVLGLLGLLFGFSLSMAVSRYEARKDLVLGECNAISTLWLRSQFLPPEIQAPFKALIREYTGARIDFHEAGLDQQKLSNAYARAEALQAQLWALTTPVASQKPTSIPLGLLIESLNEVMDDSEKRRVALDNHVPDVVVFLLFANSIVALGFVGFSSGLSGRRHLWTGGIVALLFGLVLMIILDIDRPTRGLVLVTQDCMVRLRDSLATTP